ncbi:hypothetical protein [Marinimicrobium sp.]|uniref:hypothetical protein n=1 Tax=Marinimicrobium sp. TaxID=2024837 RepID=UPI0025804FD7|nr:hypothetical protein [Marinimicrobium sp.]
MRALIGAIPQPEFTLFPAALSRSAGDATTGLELMEINPLLNQLKDLTERTDVLRRYL